MSGKRVLAALSVPLCCLLAACGPHNTLAVGKGSEDFRLKNMESSLQKAQTALQEMEKRQAETEARAAALDKQVIELSAALRAQGVKMPDAAVPRGSALGMGFADPAAAAASAAPSGSKPGGPAVPPPVAAPASAPASSRPSPPLADTGQGIPMPPMQKLPPAKAQPATRASDSKSRHGLGRVGPAEPPVTPEAAIAADKAATTTPSPAATEKTPPQTSPPPQAATTAPGLPDAPAPQTPPPPPPADGKHPAGAAETALPTEKTEYNKALQLAINGNVGAAKAAFEQFLTDHPQSTLAPNALYWVGEGAYAAGDYKTAITDFEKVAKGWPGHGKAADALYKLAMAQEKSGDTAAARASYARYLKDYPNAELAGLVRQKLQALPQ
jgi:tol-pal system protein YbgF